MTESAPKVSIVLPTYNGERYLQRAIESCLEQTHQNIELVVVDDCSTDSTPEIIKIVHGSAARIRPQSTQSGLAARPEHRFRADDRPVFILDLRRQ